MGGELWEPENPDAAGTPVSPTLPGLVPPLGWTRVQEPAANSSLGQGGLPGGGGISAEQE